MQRLLIMSEDIYTVERETPFIEAVERNKFLPFRELGGLNKQLRTIRGSLKVTIAKPVDLKGRIKHEENKLNELQDPTYSDDQRNMIKDRIKKIRDELNEGNEEIDILKPYFGRGRANLPPKRFFLNNSLTTEQMKF